MAFKQDDVELALMGLSICDALEERDDTRTREAITKARKHAHRVIDRGRKQPDDAPETPAEGETE